MELKGFRGPGKSLSWPCSAVPQAQFSKCLLVSRFRFRNQLIVRWLRVLHSEMFKNTRAHCIPQC